MTPRFCYWSVVDGDYSLMMAAVIHSARRAGVDTDFHVWSDVPVPGSIHHPAGTFEKWGCLFKLEFLRHAVKELSYDYFVWLDTDMWFVRDPGNVLRLLRGAPLHIALETDLTRVDMRRQEWWGCPNQRVVELMRQCGVLHPQVFNVNGGLFIVHRDAIDTVYRLAFEFSDFCKQHGFTFNDEPLLAYAMQRLCHGPNLHTLKATLDVWCSDWTGQFQDRLPDGQPWLFLDYFTEEPVLVNPAIVHAMRSKNALVSLGQELMTTVPQV